MKRSNQEPSSPRRRYQNGQLIDGGDRWEARWRVDVVQPDGRVKRVRKWDVIAPKKGVSLRMVEQILANRMHQVNGEARDRALVMHWLDTVGVELCDTCRRRLIAALSDAAGDWG